MKADTKTKPDPLLALVRITEKQARVTIEDDGEELINHFVGETESGALNMIVVPWADSASRLAMLAIVRAKFREWRVVRYCHVAESWMGKRANLMPRLDPEREEVLSIVAVDRPAGIRTAYIYPIERLPNGKRRVGQPNPEANEDDGVKVGGASLEILEGDGKN